MTIKKLACTWFQPSIIIALITAVTLLLGECRRWREQAQKNRNGMEYYESAFSDKLKGQ